MSWSKQRVLSSFAGRKGRLSMWRLGSAAGGLKGEEHAPGAVLSRTDGEKCGRLRGRLPDCQKAVRKRHRVVVVMWWQQVEGARSCLCLHSRGPPSERF